MLTWFRNRSLKVRKASDIYGAVVAQARRPEFYAPRGIPDTAEGRYELVVLHLFLVLERLRVEGPGAEALARGIIEVFVADMDANMREMGVGDMSVARRVKRAAAGFYERAGHYREALAGVRSGVAPALEEFLGVACARAAPAYLSAGAQGLAAAPLAEIEAARLTFPDPALLVAGARDGGAI